MRREVSIVITDLDNTLYDWVDIWYRGFRPMLDVLVSQSGISEDKLCAEIKAVYERHGTAEYAFLIEELPSLQEKHPGENLKEIYEDAIKAYCKGRKAATKLYPTVRDTLDTIRAAGALIVAYTESQVFYACSRMKRLELDNIIDFIYSPPDHNIPGATHPEDFRMYPPEHYQLSHTGVRTTPKDKLKPSVEVLLAILKDFEVSPSSVAYIGDDLVKDVSMGQGAGVLDAWAKYGKASYESEEYKLLKRVTHWPQSAVDKQKKTDETHIRPTITLEKQFAKILEYVKLIPFGKNTSVKQKCF